jgi:hypothetical protein
MARPLYWGFGGFCCLLLQSKCLEQTLVPTYQNIPQDSDLSIAACREPLLCNDREVSKYTRAVSGQWLGKHVPATTDTHAITEVLLNTVFPTRSVQRGYKENNWGSNTFTVTLRVVGGDEKGSLESETVKYPIKTTLARASSIYKRHTRPLTREGSPQKQDRNCQRVINIWS